MLFSTPVDVLIHAKDEDEARDRLNTMFRFIGKFYSKDFGFEDWHILNQTLPSEEQ